MARTPDPERLAPDTIDLEALDLGHMARYARTATFAPNWWAVLLADGSVGLAVAIVGILIATLWIGWLGLILIIVGVIYLLLVGRRFLQWRWLRQQAGL